MQKPQVALIERVSFGKTSNCPFSLKKEKEVPSCRGNEGESDAVSSVQHGVLLGFLGLPLARAVAQLLLGFER